jgi:diguanylate cyclase (GGDEF)-like protein
MNRLLAICLVLGGAMPDARAWAATDTPPAPGQGGTATDARRVAESLGPSINALGLLTAALGAGEGALVVHTLQAHLMQALHATAPARLAWQRVEAVAGALGDMPASLNAIERQAEAALLLSDYASSRVLAEKLLRLARRAGSSDYEASAQGYFGILARRQGDLDAALGHYNAAIELLRDSGNEFRKALILSNLGTLMRDRGDFARALGLQLDALAIRERIGDRLETSLRNIALLYREIEDEQNARSYFERALANADRSANPETYSPVLGSYASLLNDVGDHAAALAAAREALGIDISLGNRSNQGLEQLEVGRALYGLGQPVEALDQLESALAIGRELDQREIVARSLLHLAEINQAQHDSLRARGMIDEAIAGLEAALLRPQLVQAYAVREKIALAEHDPESALRFLRRHAEQRELLLGTRASRQLGELQARHARAEAEKDLALLQKDNELQNARLDKQDVERKLGMVALVSLGLALLLGIWRYHGVFMLNRTLLSKNLEIDAQSKALADANERLEERAAALYQAAITDPLTGVCNRSHLRERASRRLARCVATGCDMAVLVIDYDCFKQVNDQLGHLFGDRVLVAGVAAMRQCLDDDDILGRFGGEEFVVILGSERAAVAEHIAEALRDRVRQSLAQLPTQGIAVTVSIGLARLSDLAQPARASVDSLLDAGDRAMYAAKAAGRNRVARFSATPQPLEDAVDG